MERKLQNKLSQTLRMVQLYQVKYEFYQLRPPYIGRGVPIEYMYYM